MEAKNKAPEGAIQNLQCKVNDSSAVLQRIKQYFLDGEKGTVIDIFELTGIRNPMVMISHLREVGWKIREKDQEGLLFFWLDHEQRTQILCGVWKGGDT